MSNSSSHAYMKKWAELFAGALPENYMTPWDPQSLIQTNWTHSTIASGTSSNILQWNVADEDGTQGVYFHTTATLTGHSWVTIPSIALYRLVCLTIIARLDEDALKDASESLIDIYQWRFIQVAGIDRSEAAPFVVRDE
jgi:hypothetical protein